MNQIAIKLFVHGVPNGQDTWGLQGGNSAEAQYIRSFYNQGTDGNAQMYVDIRQYDGQASTYYTYKQDKTVDSDNRSGGYCALTIRIGGYYYADIQNMFNLLKAAFDKYIVGNVLKGTSGSYQFLISKFEQKQDDICRLENDIRSYLMNFSSNPDFMSLSDFPNNAQGQVKAINLIDAVPSLVESVVKMQCRVIVSMSCPTIKELRTNAQVNNRIMAAQKQAQQDIEAAQRQAAKQIDAIKKKEEEAIKDAKTLRVQLESAKSELNGTEDKLAKIKGILQGINGRNTLQPGSQAVKSLKKLFWLSCITLTLSAAMLCLALFYGFGRETTAAEANTPEIAETPSKDKPIDKVVPSVDPQPVTITGDLIDMYKNARIDISYISPQKPMRLSTNDYYPVRLKNAEADLKCGQWQSSDFEIDGDRIKPKHSGKCTISYVVDGTAVKTREIDVAE